MDSPAHPLIGTGLRVIGRVRVRSELNHRFTLFGITSALPTLAMQCTTPLSHGSQSFSQPTQCTRTWSSRRFCCPVCWFSDPSANDPPRVTLLRYFRIEETSKGRIVSHQYTRIRTTWPPPLIATADVLGSQITLLGPHWSEGQATQDCDTEHWPHQISPFARREGYVIIVVFG